MESAELLFFLLVVALSFPLPSSVVASPSPCTTTADGASIVVATSSEFFLSRLTKSSTLGKSPNFQPLQKSSQSPSAIFNNAKSNGRLNHSTSQLTTCGPKEARARTVLALRTTWALVTMRIRLMAFALTVLLLSAALSSSCQRMRKPVPELSRCCLLLQGSLYDRETLVTNNFTTGRVLLDDDEDLLGLEDFTRFLAAAAFNICIETPPPVPAAPSATARTPLPPPSSRMPSIPSSTAPPPSWLLSSSDMRPVLKMWCRLSQLSYCRYSDLMSSDKCQD
mmetsp:Transcript_37170/g.77851  ORF Transcript_37170/g.77851 Transcript_37170/m.77851 type:complete len:280 (+) Transcript_37170:1601-2440(+)